MLDATGKKLVRLLRPDSPAEVRAAAALVVGELGLRDPAVAAALCAAVEAPEETVRQQALVAGGKLRVEALLPVLMAKISAGGVEAELAAQAAARLGSKGLKAVQELMASAPPGLKRRLAGALAGSGTTSAETVALEALLDKDPGVADAAVRSLLNELPTLTPSHRRALADHLLDRLSTKKQPTWPAHAETAMVRVLAALGDNRAEAVFWQRLSANNPLELRAACLQALGGLSPPSDRDRLRLLLACAADADFRVAAPALMLLKDALVTERTLKDWLPLFDAPDVPARRFVIDKLAHKDLPEVAAGLLRQLNHRDRTLREQALAVLVRLKSGRRALSEAVLAAETPEDAWTLARAQVSVIRDNASEHWDRLLPPALALMEAGDRRAEPLLFLLRELDAVRLRDQIEARALALRKKKNYAGALACLRTLTRDPACAEAIRFEAAALELRLSEKELAAEARAADPCLQHFARLIHNHDIDPAERLRQAKWLEPEDLFYLGFHFLEGNRQERQFGAAVLHCLQERFPRSKLARNARSKLRSAGMD